MEPENASAVIEVKQGGGPISDSTSKQYDSRIRAVVRWVRGSHPECFDEERDCLKLPLTSDILGDLCLHASQDTNGSLKSNSIVVGFQSAVHDMYRRNGVKMDTATKIQLSEFVASHKKKIALLHPSENVSSGQQNEVPISVETYLAMSSSLLSNEDEDFSLSIMSQLHMLLSWNLLSRSLSVTNIMYDHVTWVEDSLLIEFMSKSAIPYSYSKHVYANPAEPALCPILSFGLKILCNPPLFDDNYLTGGFVFCNVEVDQRIAQKLSSELRTKATGYETVTMSTFQYGAVNYLDHSGECPMTVDVYRRAGWDLGSMMHRDMYVDSDHVRADQHVGRMCSCLPPGSPEFSILPPHFEAATVLTAAEWENVVPGFSKYSPSFQKAIPYLVASVVYHSTWLVARLPISHPLFQSALWTGGFLTKLAPLVLTGNMKCEKSGMSATGLFSVGPTAGSSNCSLRESLLTRMSTTDEVLENLNASSGFAPSTVPSVHTKRKSLSGGIRSRQNKLPRMDPEKMDTLIPLSTAENCIVNSSLIVPDHGNPNIQGPATICTWEWGSRTHPVPEGYSLPWTNVKHLWDLWNFGQLEANIGPLRGLKSSDLGKGDSSRLSRARAVMTAIQAEALDLRLLNDWSEINKMSIAESDVIFEKALASVMAPNPDDHRLGELSYSTVYYHILKKSKKEPLV